MLWKNLAPAVVTNCTPSGFCSRRWTLCTCLQTHRVIGSDPTTPPPPKRKTTTPRTGVRQGPEDEGVLQALPGQVPPQARGQDRLPGPQEVDLPGQEQVQLPQVQAGGALHQQVRAGAGHLRHHPGRRVHVPGLLQGAPPVRLQGRTQELRRGVLHGSPGGPPPAPPAGETTDTPRRERERGSCGYDL